MVVDRNSAFEKLKNEVIRITPLKHFNGEAECILTTDASPLGLGKTLWQKEEDGRRPVAFALRYLGDSEKTTHRTNLNCWELSGELNISNII